VRLHQSQIAVYLRFYLKRSFQIEQFQFEHAGLELSLGEHDERTVVDLLIDQIEFCDVIMLNKIDLIDQAQQDQLTHHVVAVSRLNRNL
jgi:G3E family GTPase